MRSIADFSSEIPLQGSKISFGKYPTFEEYTALLKESYTIYVDLTETEEIDEGFRYDDFEKEESIVILKNPIKDRTPNSKNSYKFTQILYLCINFYRQRKNIYISCRGGHGRSAMFAAILLSLITSNTAKESLDIIWESHQKRRIMKDKWRKLGAPQTKSQKQFVYDYLEKERKIISKYALDPYGYFLCIFDEVKNLK